MKFILECGEIDGLILIDKSYLTELNSDMLYAMEVLLDLYGRSELICDFPYEAWDMVRSREIRL